MFHFDIVKAKKNTLKNFQGFPFLMEWEALEFMHLSVPFLQCSFLSQCILSNDRGKGNSNFFCYAATVLSPHRNVLIFTQRMHKPT